MGICSLNRRVAPLLAIAPLFIAACSSGAPAARTSGPAPDSSAPGASSSPTSSPASSPTSSPTAPPPSDAPASGKPDAPPRESPFFVAYEQPMQGIRIYPMGSVAVVLAGSHYLNELLLMDAQGIRSDKSLYKGLPGHDGKPSASEAPTVFALFMLEGDWPKSGRLSLNIPGDRGGTDIDYQLKNGTWSALPDRHTEEYYRAYYGGILGAGTSFRGEPLHLAFNGDGWRFIYDSKSKKIALPTLAPAPKGLKCGARLARYLSLASLDSGELYGVGQVCVEGDGDNNMWDPSPSKGPLAVERWPSGQRTSTLDILPNQSGLLRAYGEDIYDSTWLSARSPTDVYVASSLSPDGTTAGIQPYVAHFDGRAWTEIAMPAKGLLKRFFVRTKDGLLWAHIGDAIYRRPPGEAGKKAAWERLTPEDKTGLRFWEIAPDETLWARYGDQLFQRPVAGGAWKEAPLPNRDPSGKPAVYLPSRLAFWNSEVFVVSDMEEGRDEVTSAAILRSSRPASVVHASAPVRSGAPSALVTAATPSCKETFVVLYKLAKTAPADFDFPLTREALKGHREFGKAEFAETVEAGRRYLVAFVPTFAMGRSLVKLVTEKVKGSAPQLMCGKPVVNRTLKFNLVTGALVK